MNVGDLVNFMCIGAGKTDNPPYSQDGKWRTGLLLKTNVETQFHTKCTFHMVHIFYRGVVVKTLVGNCRPIGNK